MRKFYLLIFLVAIYHANSQNYNNRWKLGNLALNFSSNPPIASTQSNANYGHASVSDPSGNLLFYTDGVKVWNKNHAVMTNGTSIGIATAPYQKCVIVPHPGNSSQYYIFNTRTSPMLNIWGNTYMMTYSLVDFSTNPLGQLISVNTNGDPFVKKLNGINGDGEDFLTTYKPLTVARNNDGTGYFVITQDHNSMISFRIDGNGLNESPIISSFTSNQIYNVPNGNAICYCYRGINRSMIRITPDGQKLIGLESSGYQDDFLNHRSHLYSLNFNNETGHFTNYQNVEWYGMASNFEISNDSRKVYMTRTNHHNYPTSNLNGEIIVKDLQNLTLPVRKLGITGTNAASSKFSNLQKDKYGNLWVSSGYSDENRNRYLHKIENQDSYSSSTISINAVSLNTSNYIEFPQLIQELSVSCPEAITVVSPEISTSKIYRSSDYIISQQNYSVSSTQDIEFRAGNYVLLRANTHIKAGAKFVATIAECGTPSSDRKSITSRIGDSGNFDKTKLYPNPNNGIFTILTDNALNLNISLSVFDTFGKIIYETTFNEGVVDLNIGNLNAGVYFVKLTKNQTTETLKFIKY